MKTLEQIKEMIVCNTLDEAERALQASKADIPLAEYYYWMGNIYRKRGDWSQALTYYYTALEEDADSPAKIAAENLNKILDYRNTDLINP